MASKRRMRDFQRCLRTIQSFSDNQAQILEWDDEGLEWVNVVIKPKDGYYMGGTFMFKIFFERDYPKCPPRVDCVTPIYHPNIDTTCEDYNVCLNLFDCWEDKFGLEDIIQGLLFLMYNPNIEDPLSPYFDPGMDDEEFKKSVERSLQGEEIEGAEEYPRNFSEDGLAEEQLTESINLILEKASKMVLREEEEEKEDEGQDSDEDSDSGSVIEVGAASQNSGATEESGCACDEAKSAEVKEGNVSQQEKSGYDLTRYIPRTFIFPQPDILETAFMTCFDIVTS